MSRFFVFAAAALAAVIAAVAALAGGSGAGWFFLVFAALALLGVWDLVQPRHTLLRNYPLSAHVRWLFESIRPELRQYLFESDRDAVPFSREQRSLVYQRAKNDEARRPFGTREDVYQAGYSWLAHSAAPKAADQRDFRVTVGSESCNKPYNASLYNISAMSFGALGANAIRALNKGAKLGNFAHDTGEGGISRYHREFGGDLIWELGSGYFGCRTDDGLFDPARFKDQAANEQIKMVEIKLSQGAKPGHGGVLPGAKVTVEIAEARGVPIGRECVSPAAHRAFTTPLELMDFIARLREGSGGKPVGFKLCVGHRWEFMAMVKAMLQTGIAPDFIVVDGKEGGTGAAPLEFINHVGTPLVDGLTFVNNALIGAGLRDKIRLGASGKLISAFDLVWAHALGADWCNAARGFMFALGCVQAQQCHSNRCPTGIATQDALRQRGLVVADKAERVANFHRNTMHALAEIIGAAGLTHPSELQPRHLLVRQKNGEILTAEKAYRAIAPGEIVSGDCDKADYRTAWDLARADSFTPAG
ncbi:MAG: FMN-binding glutamate synthase family protein [Rhodobacteraceae bacterium]|nr:FMN-binding glutamate synthase family protein [Paracoccaceae bacterium]